jgi:hypothetical protein
MTSFRLIALIGPATFVTKPVNWRLLSYQLLFVLRAHRAMAQRASIGLVD